MMAEPLRLKCLRWDVILSRRSRASDVIGVPRSVSRSSGAFDRPRFESILSLHDSLSSECKRPFISRMNSESDGRTRRSKSGFGSESSEKQEMTRWVRRFRTRGVLSRGSDDATALKKRTFSRSRFGHIESQVRQSFISGQNRISRLVMLYAMRDWRVGQSMGQSKRML